MWVFLNWFYQLFPNVFLARRWLIFENFFSFKSSQIQRERNMLHTIWNCLLGTTLQTEVAFMSELATHLFEFYNNMFLVHESLYQFVGWAITFNELWILSCHYKDWHFPSRKYMPHVSIWIVTVSVKHVECSDFWIGCSQDSSSGVEAYDNNTYDALEGMYG